MYLKAELYELIRTDERIFDFIQESALDGLWYWDLENPENEWMNAKFWTVLGYSPDEMPHKSSSWQGIINQDDLKLATENFTRHCENPHHPYDQVVRYTHKNGSTVWIRCRGMAIRDNDGKPIRMLGAHQDISNLKRREKELIKAKEKAEESEQNLFITLHSIGDGVIATDNSGRIDRMNPMALKLCGWDEDDVKGKPLTEVFNIINAQTREPVPNPVEKVLESGEIVGLANHTVLVAKDGREYQIADSAAPIKNQEGVITGVVLVFSDVTEQYKSEQLIEQSKERYRIISETTNDFVFSCMKEKNDYVIDWIAGAVKNNTGYSADDIKAKKCWRFMVHPDDDSLFVKHVLSLEPGEESECELRILDPKGATRWLSVKTICFIDERQDKNRVYGGCRDITARKEAEAKLAESEARYRNILEVAPVGIAIHQNDKIVFVNPEGLKIIGADSDDQVIGKEITEIIHPDNLNKLRDRTQRMQKGEQGLYPAEDKYLRLDGEVIDVEVVATIITYNNEPAVQVVIADITERKKILNELIAAKEKAEESDRLKSAFLANMSHEIRTPMSGIMGFAELLKDTRLSDDQQQHYIEIIEKSGERMLNIINDIVDISRIEAGVMEVGLAESNINEQLEYIYTFFRPQVEAKGLQLILSKALPSGQEKIITDREKLFSILTNLVKNAIKYSKEGTIEYGCNKKGSFLEFFVRDTGIGIPKDRQHAVFERFIQADIEDIEARQGAGLGLAISKAYVEMLGGEIWAESEEGKGSTFYFSTPYKTNHEETDAQTVDEPAVEKEDQVKGLKILIVEDDELSALLMSKYLQPLSKIILQANSGRVALEICKNHPDIDLILMDIKMPGMDGEEATRQIRKFNKDVVIIAQTAKALRSDRQSMLCAGCNDYISKPIKKNEIQTLVQKYFGE